MRKNFLKIFAVLAIIGILITPKVFAALAAVTASPGVQDVHEIDNATPGTSKTFLGTRLRGVLQIGSATEGSHSTGAAVSLTATTAAVTHTSSAAHGDSNTLADGYLGQLVTFVLTTDGGQDWYITPSTKTGFTSVQLNDAKDSVTLRFVDATVGWVITGNNGANVN